MSYWMMFVPWAMHRMTTMKTNCSSCCMIKVREDFDEMGDDIHAGGKHEDIAIRAG